MEIKKECYICGHTFIKFSKYGGGYKNVPVWRKKLEIVGSDIDNFGCPYCGSHDRERHLFMYFDKLNIWSKMKNSEILHLAPEKNLSKKIEQQCNTLRYIKADLYPSNNTIKKIDITNIPFKDKSFDFVICNHVLEHVTDHIKALKEIYRVLKLNGIGILQTPYSKLLQNNFEDKGIDTDELRILYHGQADHVRTFGEKHFFKDLIHVGFSLQIVKHKDFFDEEMAKYYGVNSKEDLIKVVKFNN